jgi:hypothetical protein
MVRPFRNLQQQQQQQQDSVFIHPNHDLRVPLMQCTQ